MRLWSRAIDDSALRNVKVLTLGRQYSPEVSGPFFAQLCPHSAYGRSAIPFGRQARVVELVDTLDLKSNGH